MRWVQIEGNAYWILTVVFFLLIGTWETFQPKVELSSVGRRWRNHGLMLAITAICNTLLVRVSPVAVSLMVANSRFGLLNRPGLPLLLRCAIAIAILDLMNYWIHRCYHLLPWLWRVHQVHHSDPDYDVSTAARFHPIEAIMTASVILGVIAILAPPPVAVLTSVLINVFVNVSDHANASLPEGVDKALRFVFITPDIHRIHHSQDIRDQQLNLGVAFSWWDRMFGTYTPAASSGMANYKTGLEGMENEDRRSLGFMLAEPFQQIKRESSDMRPDAL